MKSGRIIAVLVLLTISASATQVNSHCEIPCGIYDDQARITLLKEHISTIEKSMDQIAELDAKGSENFNQLVRWIVNKENHADKFMEIVTQYFMTQRVKPTEPSDPAAFEEYQKSLGILHKMLVKAMKCKQTVEKDHTNALRQLVDDFAKHYFNRKY